MMVKTGALVVGLAMSFGTAAGVQPVTVTNVAGRVAVGELVAVTERFVRLRMAAGGERNIPLRVLAPSERVRLRNLAGIVEPAPPALARIDRDLANDLMRIDAREAAGTLTAEDAARRRAEARSWAHFRKQKLKVETAEGVSAAGAAGRSNALRKGSKP